MSDRHIGEELPLLLTGEASRDTVLAAAAHLRTCPDCQQELVSAVVAHSSLASARRFAPEVMRSVIDADVEVDDELTDHVAVHDDPAADTDGSGDTGDTGDTETEGTRGDASRPLPDLSSLFAQARSDAEQVAVAPAARRHRRRLVALGAAAAVIVGGGATVAAVELGSSGSHTRTVQLSAFDRGLELSGRPRATVTVDGDRLKIDASKLPALDSRHVYELWVTDRGRKSMQPVGTFTNARSVQLSIATKVMAQYTDFEVSLQKSDQTREYSNISVVRGDYAD